MNARSSADIRWSLRADRRRNDATVLGHPEATTCAGEAMVVPSGKGGGAGKGCVRHVAPIGHTRHEQVSWRLPSRLVSWASAPEFGELLGKGSALVVTGSSSGWTQRLTHRIGAEHVLGVAVREDRLDSAAACA